MVRVGRQAGVIPYRIRSGRVEVALITSAGGKRWTIPKGSLDAGERPKQAALRETEEEAGLRGRIEGRRLGRYAYRRDSGRFRVDVFVMRVTEVLDNWSEAGHRRRRWLRVPDAASRLRDQALRAILIRLEVEVGTG
jgi:8-oxo-dGTP pyrophosphatase MutT (NUDIX family)